MRKHHTILVLVMAVFVLSFADRSVQVFSRDEGFAEGNISKPRIYIKNTGDDTLTFLRYYYYFTTEDSKLPVFDDYYSPNVNIAIELLHDSLYRVTYEFSGNIFPGAMYPSEVENVIGLHYPDWSPWNKENDYSKSFGTYVTFLNANIPVYDENDSLLFGVEPSDTGSGGTPPPDENDSLVVIPAGTFPMGNYAVYGIESVNIADNDTIKNGKVGSNTYIEVGCDALVKGDIVAGGNLFLRERASVEGSVQIAGVVSRQNGTLISGSETDSMIYEPVQLPVVSVTPGTENKIIPVNQSETVYPGAYDTLIAYAGAIVTLKPGSYSFNTFMLEPEVHLVAELNGGAPIIVNVQNMFRFADRCTVDLPIAKEYPMSLQFYTAQTEQVFIGNDAVFKGIVCAPEAEISVNSRTKVFGGVYGKRVTIQPNVILCKPPVLADLYHSEITFAPSFDPLNTFYTTIISPDVITLNVLPTAEDTGITVTVNGNNPTTPVTLSGASTDITILLTDSSGCSGTRYLLRVQRSPNYMIYVNDNSPCTPGAEDGETWSTAWKDLQDALDNAAVTGREIWVAEGTYKPSARTVSDDPRSATFMVRAGMEIIGAFNGEETEKEQTGSPYNTILSGDLEGNDDSITVFPPADSLKRFLNDNCYHVVTMSGTGKRALKLLGCTMTSGAATGPEQRSRGAGLYNKSCTPEMELCIFTENYADSGGAGMFDNGGVRKLTNCLFENNVTVKGNGAGLSVVRSNLILDASVFYHNSTLDTFITCGGGALYAEESSLFITNSIFTGNQAVKGGGALFCKGVTMEMASCTMYDNVTDTGAAAIRTTMANCALRNTILWNSGSATQVTGTGFSINYCCIQGGYAGTANIIGNPMLTNGINPAGADSHFGSMDDGLQLQAASPCKDAGIDDITLHYDILKRTRISGAGIDIGAYEYFNVNKLNKVFFGCFIDGNFIENDSLEIITLIKHPKQILQYSRSNYHRVARAYIEKNKGTESRQFMTAYVQPVDSIGNPLAPEMQITLKKIGVEDGLLVFQTIAPDYSWGKRIIFVDELYWHGVQNPWAYVIYARPDFNLSYTVPIRQFIGR